MQPRAIDSGKIRFMQVVCLIRVQHHSSNADPPSLGASARHFFAGGEKMVGVRGVEPRTLRLSSACSNQLSYTPKNQSKVPSLKSKVSRRLKELVELRRLELLTYSLQSYRSTN